MWGGKQLYAFVGGGAAGAAQVTTANGTIHTWTIPFRCTPIRAGVTVLVAPGTAAPVLTFGAAGICGVITVPTTATANQCYYDDTDFTSYSGASPTWTGSLDEGDQVAVVVSNQSTSTGSVIPFLVVEINPEQPGNNSAMVRSA